jgi:hypothetical protein
MKKHLCLIGILFLVFQSQAQTIRLPEDGFVEGWTKGEKTRRFVRANLYDYIDGGAELFLEFGFEDLIVQDYRKESQEISLEVYRMENGEAALGIYLMKCGQETPHPEIPARNSADKLQFLVLKNNFLLLVNNFKGDEALIPVMVTIGQNIIGQISEAAPVKILSLLPLENLIPGTQRLIRGPLALQSIFTLGEGDILQLKGSIFGVSGQYESVDGSSHTRIIVAYPSHEDAREAFQHLYSNLDRYLKVLNREEHTFQFEDYKKQYGIVSLKDKILSIRVNLSELPASGHD